MRPHPFAMRLRMDGAPVMVVLVMVLKGRAVFGDERYGRSFDFAQDDKVSRVFWKR